MTEFLSIIKIITLNQRAVLFDLRKDLPLARFDLEVLCLVSCRSLFNPYDVRKHFIDTAPQQIYRCFKKLVKLGVFDKLTNGNKQKAFCYIVTEKGYSYLNKYYISIGKALPTN